MKINVEARTSITGGVKRTLTEQLAPGWMIFGSVHPGVAAKSAASPPLTLTEVSVTGVSSVFLNATFFAALVVLTAWLPNDSVVLLRDWAERAAGASHRAVTRTTSRETWGFRTAVVNEASDNESVAPLALGGLKTALYKTLR